MKHLLIEPLMPEASAAAWATPSELALAATFGSPRRRREFLAWRAVARRVLGAAAEFAYNQVGAPIVVGCDLHLGVSHCATHVTVCISDRPCAVDIESSTRDFSRAMARYITPSECALSNDPLFPAVAWCAKETLYKLSGSSGLDLLCDIHLQRVDLAAGTITGCITNGEPFELSVRCDDGLIVVYFL